MKIATIAWIFLLLAPKAEVGKAVTDFNKGNEFYQSGDYNKAVEYYELALHTGYMSAELYYNLGNSYYKTGQVGRSILNYERAKRLDSRDPDIQYNLDIAQLRIVDKINEPPQLFYVRFWNKLAGLFNIRDLGYITLVFYVLFIVFVIVRILSRSMVVKKVAKIAAIPVLVLLLFTSLLFLQRVNSDIHVKHGIVIVDKVDATSSPSQGDTIIFTLHEGVKVVVSEQSGDYLEIKLADGNIGWIRAGAVEII
ncbi:MAG TPA: tetratricopeptide repeat protein [bacterium]|nr:tetratricopeptide repeat protein [bacterium]HPN44513.1 tetratricopeptide repeat protein [bacterium]